MPNYCNYRMVVIGYPNNVGNFLQVINNPYNYGNIYFFPYTKIDIFSYYLYCLVIVYL